MTQREQERQRANQVRRKGFQQQGALAQCLAHQPEVQLLEVAQPAVHQLARAARGPRGEVALLDEAHRQPAQRGIEGHPGAGDPAADDEHVDAALEGLPGSRVR